MNLSRIIAAINELGSHEKTGSMKTSITVPRGKALIRAMLLLSGLGIALSGCIYAPPPPYAYGVAPGVGYASNYAYAPNYYAPGYAYGPGYYFGPSFVFGGRWNHEGGEHRR